MTLSLYIARRFLTTFLIVLGAFCGVLFLIDMVDQVRRVPDSPMSGIVGLALLHVPGTVYHVLPLIMMLTAIALFLRLARTSELVAVRAAGRSALRTVAGPALAALILGAIAVAVFDPLVAATSKRYAIVSGEGATLSEASLAGDGLWLRQGDPTGQWVIRAASVDPSGTTLNDVTFLQLGADGQPATRVEAKSASLQDGQWVATDAKEWRFDAAVAARSSDLQPRLLLKSTLTADQIRDSLGDPSELSIWDLRAYITQLERAGFSSTRYAVWFQMELALPLLLAAMVLVGSGFTMRHVRFGQSGPLVLAALVCGIAIFFVRNFAQVLGDSGQIPILLAAWSPPVAAALLAVSLLLHLEDG